jgi:all-trans-8'-apo-beta-carotenal 15,15'-oxygenase
VREVRTAFAVLNSRLIHVQRFAFGSLPSLRINFFLLSPYKSFALRLSTIMTSLQTRSLDYAVTEWQRGYESLTTEHSYAITDIEGDLPVSLEGTLFRNGPGKLDINGDLLQHPFDGDGMISAVSFKDGKAWFRNRYVRTEGFLAESAAGKILYRGVFGTQKPGGWLANIFDVKFKNIANTSIIYWGGRLMALWEAGLPHELEPHTLDTIGPSTLEGLLKGEDAWSAHPRVDPGEHGQEPRLVNFSVKTGLSTQVTVYELDPRNELLQRKTFTIPGFAFIHDFAITLNYYIFFQNPVSLNPIPFVLGLRGAGQCIAFNDKQPTRVWVMPRNEQGKVRVLETESCFVFHHANAYEVDNELVVDSICYANFPTVEPNTEFRNVEFGSLPEGQLWRFRIDLTRETIHREVITDRCCEFPTLNPQRVGRPYEFAVLGAAHGSSGNAPLQSLVKLDLRSRSQTTWSAAPKGFVGEPLFVAKPNAGAEDEGWILATVYDAEHHRTDIVVLDAQAFERGPVARLHLTHHIPYGLHGCFVPDLFLASAES